MSKNGGMYEFQPLVLREHKSHSQERPRGRSGHRIVCDGKYLYSFGGFNPCIPDNDPDLRHDQNWLENRPLFRELWKFNYSTERWKRLLPSNNSMPTTVASSAMLLKDRTLVVYGGTGVPFGANCSNMLYVWNLRNGNSRLLPYGGALPQAGYGQAMFTQGPYLYTIGGTTGYEYTSDIHRYDLRTNQWEAVYICRGDASEPKGRYRHEIAFDGSVIYILGGGTAYEAFDFKDIPAFDLASNRWMTLSAVKDRNHGYPEARRCHGSVQYTDEKTGEISIVISGGYSGSREFQDIWRLDLGQLQWTCVARCFFQSPLYFHSVALTPQGKMYTFGGIKTIPNGVTRTDAIHSTWLVIPKLQEICWEALNYYVKDLRNRPLHDLAAMGIPSEFLQRLKNDDDENDG
ncbi:kelch domain-containing protein 10 homolog [Venturia canescens]|uniref:kelch domain-containing protein 10 homolog n=1 Tax=Venturia canescens TaxID=32260 RepID=UPI001C9C7670|nr:kelch domain-containing protein 10 homolog [Venturia canescens]